MTVIARLLEHAARRPDAPIFTFTTAERTETLDRATLLARVRAFAGGLRERGIVPGDRVVLRLGTSPELVALVLAAQAVGALPMIVNPQLPEPAIARRVAAVAAALVVDEGMAPGLARADAPAELSPGSPDDVAYLQLTSGTSGEPRAVAITHRALVASFEGARVMLALRDDDVLVGWVPLHHDLGLVRFLFTPVYFGLHAHLLPPSVASLGLWLRTLTATRATVTGAPDFAYRIAARTVSPAGIDLGALRVATNGGEPVRASSIDAFERRFGCPGVIRPGYGLAEATLGVSTTLPGDPLRIDARGHVGCGRVVPGLVLRVVRDGVVQPAGTVGDLEIAGPAVLAGHYDPRAPGGLDRGCFTADGWMPTGDTGYVDGDGTVFALGRTRAMVKQAGALIAPREVEEVVDALPGVRFSAAVGLPSPITGHEELVVVVETRDSSPDAGLEGAVIRAVREQVGVAPARVLAVPARTIPLTPNGKIRHAALRASLVANSG